MEVGTGNHPGLGLACLALAFKASPSKLELHLASVVSSSHSTSLGLAVGPAAE